VPDLFDGYDLLLLISQVEDEGFLIMAKSFEDRKPLGICWSHWDLSDRVYFWKSAWWDNCPTLFVTIAS